MEELRSLLINVSDSYYDFVVGLTSYAQKSEARCDQLTVFLKNHPKAQTSDIIEYALKEMDLANDHVPFSTVTNMAAVG